ncbi:MAG: PspA/IM30 family protein [Pseudomonadota bacterium]
MFNQIISLVRGRSNDVADAVMDANALSILRQQLRDASAGVATSKKALAVVMAYADREKASLQDTRAKIADLEARAVAALDKGEEVLATEAAEAIAALEAEADATARTLDTYSAEITQLRAGLKESEAQLVALQRGQRLAEASDRAIKVRGALPRHAETDLEEASATLKRLQDRQAHAKATATAIAELSTRSATQTLEDRMAAAGCGDPTKPNGASVLARLKAAKAT